MSIDSCHHTEVSSLPYFLQCLTTCQYEWHVGGAEQHNTDVPSNFTSLCTVTEKAEEKKELKHRTLLKVKKEQELGTEKERRGCRGKEISVSAKVFIKILRQMISVSFSWSCLGRHAISMQITTSRLCSYYFCRSCCNMTQERRGGRRQRRREREGDVKWEGEIRRKMLYGRKRGSDRKEERARRQSESVLVCLCACDGLTEVWKYITPGKGERERWRAKNNTKTQL